MRGTRESPGADSHFPWKEPDTKDLTGLTSHPRASGAGEGCLAFRGTSQPRSLQRDAVRGDEAGAETSGDTVTCDCSSRGVRLQAEQ